jgi:hypothetical protein
MQTQLAVTQRKWCDFVSFDPCMPERSQLFICRVERDNGMIQEIESEVVKFLLEVEQEVNLMRGN